MGDLQEIGLPPLYSALFAVANCPGLRLDDGAFQKAAASYHLTPEDLLPTGRFSAVISETSRALTVRLLDDRQTFCSSADLQFAVVKGVLHRRPPSH